MNKEKLGEGRMGRLQEVRLRVTELRFDLLQIHKEVRRLQFDLR